MRAREPRIGGIFAGCALMVIAVFPGRAAETPQDWLRRILDPAALGVAPFPGSTLNRKLSVDFIRKADPSLRVAVYLAPLDRFQAAAKYFAERLHVDPQITGAGSPFERQVFVLGPDAPKAAGLRVELVRSPWVDDKLQISFFYRPPPETDR